jgi:peroxiredoxin
MAETPSKMLPLGTKAPDFMLPDTISDKDYSFEELKSEKGTIVVFICNHCPYVLHIIKKMVESAKEYQAKGLSFIAISSNDVENYPQDSPKTMKKVAERFGFTFPYLYDETQEVARLYQAECTPDFYLFDGDSNLVYRGRFDDSNPGNGKMPTGTDLTNAVEALIKGLKISEEQYPSIGCNIKWK